MNLELARSFDRAVDAYERGRPGFPPHVVRAIADAAGGRRVLDVGAGSGRLSRPLLDAGVDVVAVEPLDGMRAALARAIGAERALAGRAEALPLDDASVDGAVCSDAWHWFDGAAAAGELARVVRPGGGVVVCVQRHVDEGRPEWSKEMQAVLDPIWQGVVHPYRDGSRRPDGLEGHPGFEPLEVREVAFVHATDRERMLAHCASMSAVAALPSRRRAQVLGEVDAVLRRHGVETAEVPYVAELWVARRRAS